MCSSKMIPTTTPRQPSLVSSDMTSGAPEPDVDLLAALVLDVEGVSSLHAGVLGEVGTYLPGRRVNGIRLREPGCDIHVVLDWGVRVKGTTDRIRAAVRPLVAGPVDITVEDISAPTVASGEAGPQ